MTPDEASLIASEVRYLTQRFDEHAQATARDLGEIKAEVKRTNGRVTQIERERGEENAVRRAKEKTSASLFAWTAHPIIAAFVGSGVSVALYALFLH